MNKQGNRDIRPKMKYLRENWSPKKETVALLATEDRKTPVFFFGKFGILKDFEMF